MKIRPNSIMMRALDFTKRTLNPLIDEVNTISVKSGAGTIMPRFKTTANKEADTYRQVVEGRRIKELGGIRDDPRQNRNYVYRGIFTPEENKPKKIGLGLGKIPPLPIPTVGGGEKIPLRVPTPTPTTLAYKQILENIMQGYRAYGNPPIATASPHLATLGLELQQKGGNPYLPAALALKETGGLKYRPAQSINNPFGIGPGVAYPDIKTSILGGGVNKQRGLRGVLLSGAYNPYLQSGNLVDFFKTYTPVEAHNNPSYTDQVALMNELLGFFEKKKKK